MKSTRIPIVLAAIVASGLIQWGLVALGEPQAVWLWCDTWNLCKQEPKP